jgi:plastocyanin
MKSLFRNLLPLAVILGGWTAVHAATNNVQFGGALTFRPAVITINQGDTVIWTDTGALHNHTVTGPPSDPLCGGALVTSCQWTFTNAGDFAYQCNTHVLSGMTGMVHVVAAPVIVPAVLTNFTLLGGGEAQFTVSSAASQTNLVQASTNLADTNWTTISTVVTNLDSFVVTDSNAPNFQLRFYRVVSP